MTKPTGHNRLSDQTRDGFAAIALEAGPLSDDTYEHFPMVRNSNMIFRVDKNNVAILEAWRDMARANPAAFCCPHPQDQTAFNILAMGKNLSLVNMCTKSKGRCVGDGARNAKSAVNFLSNLAKNRFSVISNPRNLRCTGP